MLVSWCSIMDTRILVCVAGTYMLVPLEYDSLAFIDIFPFHCGFLYKGKKGSFSD